MLEGDLLVLRLGEFEIRWGCNLGWSSEKQEGGRKGTRREQPQP